MNILSFDAAASAQKPGKCSKSGPVSGLSSNVIISIYFTKQEHDGAPFESGPANAEVRE